MILLSQMKNVGVKSYFTEFWNWADVVVLLTAVACICINFYRTFQVEKILESLLAAPDEFANFEKLAALQMNFNYGVAMIAFFSWGKVCDLRSYCKPLF